MTSSLFSWRIAGLYLLVLTIGCLPVWWFPYFTTQDGPVHVDAVHIMSSLLKGSEFYSQTFRLNPTAPNALGHWLLCLLLPFAGPVLAGKVIVTIIFAGSVASVAWLRHRMARDEHGPLIIVLAAAMAFNSMWLMGFFNFSLGVCGFAFILGLYWPWRGQMTVRRALILGSLIVATYFCHLFCFAVVAFSIVVIALLTIRRSSRKSVALTAAALLPGAALALYYMMIGNGSPISPEWWLLKGPVSFGTLLMQIRTADPFAILRGRALPITASESSWFLVFAPGLWICIASVLMLARSLYGRAERRVLFAGHGPVLVLLIIFLAAALIGPDALGEMQGGIIRPRAMLVAAVLVVPMIPSKMSFRLKNCVLAILAYVVLFQAAVVWEYSAMSDRDASQVIDAARHVPDGVSLAAITYIPRSQFTAEPWMNMSATAGFGNNIMVWNSYEGAYPYFPVTMRFDNDKTFAHALEVNSRIDLATDNDAVKAAKREALNAAFKSHGNVDILMVIGDPVVTPNDDLDTFENVPFYQNETIKLYSRKQ